MNRQTIIIVLTLVISNCALAQTVDSLYMVIYTTGKSWDLAKQPQEQTYFKEHSANLSALRKTGTIKVGARYADKGMIVIAASDIEAASKIINADVAIQNHLFDVTIDRLNIFYDGCLDRPQTGK